MKEAITSFRGEYRWLSNFWPVQVQYCGYIFPTVEHAYQAAKAADDVGRMYIEGAKTPGDAKRRGRRIQMRSDWMNVRLEVMEGLLRQKFAAGGDLAEKLKATGDSMLIEGNDWGDEYWGAVLVEPRGPWPRYPTYYERDRWRGENHLGRLLEKIRAELLVG